jgi:hypothetical protein
MAILPFLEAIYKFLQKLRPSQTTMWKPIMNIYIGLARLRRGLHTAFLQQVKRFTYVIYRTLDLNESYKCRRNRQNNSFPPRIVSPIRLVCES